MIVLFLAGVDGLAQTANDKGRVALYPPGTASCGTWTEARASYRAGKKNDIRFTQFEAYLAGYASAFNVYISDGPMTDRHVLGGSDPDGWYAYIDKHCAEYPLHMFQQAAVSLLNDLHEKNKRAVGQQKPKQRDLGIPPKQ